MVLIIMVKKYLRSKIIGYYCDAYAVVDKPTVKKLKPLLEGIIDNVTIIDNNRYYLTFNMKVSDRFDEIQDTIKSSSYYELITVGEEITDIEYEFSEKCEFYLKLTREAYYVAYPSFEVKNIGLKEC